MESLPSRIIPGRADRPTPAGVHIERGQMRASRALRDRYESYLNELMSLEYIEPEEHAARTAAAAAAVTEADLQLLLEDLPPLPLTRDEARKVSKKHERRVSLWKRQRGLRLATYIAGIGASIVTCISLVSVFVNRPADVEIGTGRAVAIAAAVVGGIVWVAWFIILMSTDPMWKKRDLDGDWKRSWT